MTPCTGESLLPSTITRCRATFGSHLPRSACSTAFASRSAGHNGRTPSTYYHQGRAGKLTCSRMPPGRTPSSQTRFVCQGAPLLTLSATPVDSALEGLTMLTRGGCPGNRTAFCTLLLTAECEMSMMVARPQLCSHPTTPRRLSYDPDRRLWAECTPMSSFRLLLTTL